GEFRATEQTVVRPLDREARRADPRRLRDGIVQCDARYEAELRRKQRVAGVDQEKAGVEITLRGRPGPSLTSPPGGLSAGRDPEPSRIAALRGAQRIVIGR